MMSPKPLLYFSLPGVALILGVYWYRRRNKQRFLPDAGKGNEDGDVLGPNGTINFEDNSNDYTTSKITSAPLTINGVNDDSGSTKILGKSAPIQIVQNGRLDSEVLKAKMEDVEKKHLRSIDEDFENLSSSVDLPDSGKNRSSFITRSVFCKTEAPIVVKATNTPKISPENSFMENKYTPCSEENNNIQEKQTEIKKEKETQKKIISKDKAQTQKQQQQSQEINESKETANNGNDKKETTTNVRGYENSSPALSLYSNQSGDSGKGSSLPRSEHQAKIVYEFFLPSGLIGFLYGRQHTFIKHLKETTSVAVTLSKTRYAGKVRICRLEGTENGVNIALNMIRQRLPTKRYPNFTMQRIFQATPQTVVPLSNESLNSLQLNLIEGINNDVVVTSVITGGHLFVQHPLHPSHPSLPILQKSMYESYSNLDAPLLPSIEINAVCVLPVNGVWYRVQIIDNDAADTTRCLVKFLDFGGYIFANFQDLRQIRSDFMAYPFQATECVLSNIEAIDSKWYTDAPDILYEITKGIVLQAQVAGYNEQNIPEIYLFACLGPNNVIFINRELVARNLARWVDIPE